MDTWKLDVIEALTNLSGPQALKDIYQNVKSIRTARGLKNPASAEAIIRRTLEKYSSDTKTYNGKEDLFKSSQGVGKGIWELRQNIDTSLDVPYNEIEISPNDLSSDLKTLRNKVYNGIRKRGLSAMPRTYMVIYRERRKDIKVYALKRAEGHCECCGRPAPFNGKNGLPFLEVHHIHQLSEAGIDSPDNVAAITPNCHRQIHFGTGGSEIDDRLAVAIKEKELAYASSSD